MGWFDIIVLALRKTNKTNESKACLEVIWETDSERYRSGHNEAVVKTVCPQGRKGSNPFLSAVIMGTAVNMLQVVSQHEKIDTKFFLEYVSWINYFGEVLKWLKRHPWKGCRSLIAARGFKSLLLRSSYSLWRHNYKIGTQFRMKHLDK